MLQRFVRHVLIALSFGLASFGTFAEILIGQSIPTSGSLAPFGLAIIKGSQAYFDRVNAAGGVNGEAIRVLVLDDAGDSKRTVENARKLADQGVLMLNAVLTVERGRAGHLRRRCDWRLRLLDWPRR